MTRNGYRVVLPSGRIVELAEPTVSEGLVAARAAGSALGVAGDMKSAQALLKLALRSIDSAPTSITSLMVWPFSSSDTMAALGVMRDLVAPPKEALEAARASIAVEATDRSSSWTVTLPGGRKVALRELPWSGLMEAMSATDLEPQMPLAGDYRSALEGLKRSLASIDGNAPTWSAQWIDEWPLSAADTALLTAIWRDMHGLGAPAARPTLVPTTA